MQPAHNAVFVCSPFSLLPGLTDGHSRISAGSDAGSYSVRDICCAIRARRLEGISNTSFGILNSGTAVGIFPQSTVLISSLLSGDKGSSWRLQGVWFVKWHSISPCLQIVLGSTGTMSPFSVSMKFLCREIGPQRNTMPSTPIEIAMLTDDWLGPNTQTRPQTYSLRSCSSVSKSNLFA